MDPEIQLVEDEDFDIGGLDLGSLQDLARQMGLYDDGSRGELILKINQARRMRRPAPPRREQPRTPLRRSPTSPKSKVSKSPSPRQPGSSPAPIQAKPTVYILRNIYDKNPYIIGIFISDAEDPEKFFYQDILAITEKFSKVDVEELIGSEDFDQLGGKWSQEILEVFVEGIKTVLVPMKKEIEKITKVVEMEFKDFKGPGTEPPPIKKKRVLPTLPRNLHDIYSSIIRLSGAQKVADDFVKNYLVGYDDDSARGLVEVINEADLTNTQIFTFLESLVWSGGYKPKVIYTEASCSKDKKMDYWVKLFPLVEKYFSKLPFGDQIDIANCVITSLPKDAPLEWYKRYLGIASKPNELVAKAIQSNNFLMLDLIVQISPEKIRSMDMMKASTLEMASRILKVVRKHPTIKLEKKVVISGAMPPEIIDFFLRKIKDYDLEVTIHLIGMDYEQLSTVLRYQKSFSSEAISNLDKSFRISFPTDGLTFELMIPYVCQEDANASYWTQQLIKKELWPTLGILAAFKIEQAKPDLSFRTTGHFAMPQ